MSDNSLNMLALGTEFFFSLDTAAFQELERTSSWRWPAIDRVGARPVPQYVGPGEDTVTMRGTIYPHFRGGLGQVAAMRALAGTGRPFLVVDGSGRVWGQYVITDIREGQTVFFSNGKPRKIDFDLTLKMYDDPPIPVPVLLEGQATGARTPGRSRDSLELEAQTTGNTGTFDSQTIYEAAGL